jgi:hypothetical protein
MEDENFVFDDIKVVNEDGSQEPLISPAEKVTAMDGEISRSEALLGMETGQQAAESLTQLTALRIRRDDLYQSMSVEEKARYEEMLKRRN